MLAKDLKIGEYGLILEGLYKGNKILCHYENSFINLTDLLKNMNYNYFEVQKLENVKIIYDGCEETKSEFPKEMLTCDELDFKNARTRTVFGIFDNKFMVKVYNSYVSYQYAKDIESETTIELTLEEISKKLDLKDNEKLVIK